MSQRVASQKGRRIEQKLLVFLIVIGAARHMAWVLKAPLASRLLPFDDRRRETLIFTAADKTARG